MRDDVREAIESAQTVGLSADGARPRRRSFGGVRATVLAVVRELPEDMTVAELRDELEIASAQAGERR